MCCRKLQEPVAFFGGVFAGALGLNLEEDPLRSWLQRTAADAQVRNKLTTQRAAFPA